MYSSNYKYTRHIYTKDDHTKTHRTLFKNKTTKCIFFFCKLPFIKKNNMVMRFNYQKKQQKKEKLKCPKNFVFVIL